MLKKQKIEDKCELYFKKELYIRNNLIYNKPGGSIKNKKINELYKEISINIGIEIYNKFVNIKLIEFIRSGLCDSYKFINLIRSLETKKIKLINV